jgi:hypothetical protein
MCVTLLALVPVFIAALTTLRYLAYLILAWHVSRVHGVKGLRTLPAVVNPALRTSNAGPSRGHHVSDTAASNGELP